MINDADYLFMYLLGICMSSLEKYLQFLWPFLKWIGFFFAVELY